MMSTRAVVGWLTLCSLTTAAWADWDPGDPFKMHFPQLPDLTVDGLDVMAGPALHPLIPPGGPFERFLADDWQCTESGPVTGLHFLSVW